MVTLLCFRATKEKSLILKGNSFTELSTWRNVDFLVFAINCLDSLFAPKDSIKRTDLKLAFYIISLTNKLTAFPHINLDKKIAFKVSFFAQFDCISIADTFWNYDLFLCHLICSTATFAWWTKLFYFWTLTIAWCAGCVHNKWALPHSLSTTSITRVTFLWLCSGLTSVTFASVTFNSSIILNILEKLGNNLLLSFRTLIH